MALLLQDARRKEEKLGRVFAGEGDVMEEHERDKVEQNALQVGYDTHSDGGEADETDLTAPCIYQFFARFRMVGFHARFLPYTV